MAAAKLHVGPTIILDVVNKFPTALKERLFLFIGVVNKACVVVADKLT